MIEARHLRAECAVECWVRDNGGGISPALLERVFEREKRIQRIKAAKV